MTSWSLTISRGYNTLKTSGDRDGHNFGSQISCSPPKFFLCRLINHGNYKKLKAALIGHFNGKCKLCRDQEETPGHLFRSCTFAADSWIDLTRVLSDQASRLSLLSTSSLLDILDDCLHTSPTHSICLFVFFETTWFIWKKRNGDTYQEKCISFLPIILLSKALHLLSTTLSMAKGSLKRCRI